MQGYWRQIMLALAGATGLLITAEIFISQNLTQTLNERSRAEFDAKITLVHLESTLQRFNGLILRQRLDQEDNAALIEFVQSGQLDNAFREFDRQNHFLSPMGTLLGDAGLSELQNHRRGLGALLRDLRFQRFDAIAQEYWRVEEALELLEPIALRATIIKQRLIANQDSLHRLIYFLMGVSALMLVIMWLAWRISLGSKRSEEYLQAAINALGKGFIIVDAKGRVQMANAVYHEQYGFDESVKPGTPYAVVLRQALLKVCRYDDKIIDFDADTPEEVLQPLIDYRLTRMQDDHTDWEQELKSGRILLTRDAPIPGGGYVSLRTDVTGLKAIEKRLRQQIRAMDLTSDGIAVCSPDGEYSYVNQAYARLFGHDDTEKFIGEQWYEFFDPIERSRYINEILPALYRDTNWRAEVSFLRVDGVSLNQEITLDLLPSGEIICIARDMAERREAEAERDALQKQVYQAQKMEAIGRLAGGIAHDFNNILASILGYATLLEQDLPPNTDNHHFAESIRLSGERAASLVSQILAFSRSNEDQAQGWVNVCDTVNEVNRMLKATLPASIELKTNVAEGLPFVQVNPTRLNQVVMNLCVNAGDALPDHQGSIELDVRASTGEAMADYTRGLVSLVPDTNQIVESDPKTGRSRVVIGDWQNVADQEYVIVMTVQDNGSGIEPHVVAQIFEPFFTTKAVDKGTGLGLAAVHGIVLSTGGVLLVDTQPGEGTRFTVIFPARCQKILADEERQDQGELPRGDGNIMVIDDDKTIVDFLTTLLSRQGYKVDAFVKSDAAIEALKNPSHPTPDVVITDQTMPGATVLDVIHAARQRSAAIKIILCTGYSDMVDKPKALSAGADYFLEKPVAPAKLLDCLQQNLLRHQRSA